MAGDADDAWVMECRSYELPTDVAHRWEVETAAVQQRIDPTVEAPVPTGVGIHDVATDPLDGGR